MGADDDWTDDDADRLRAFKVAWEGTGGSSNSSNPMIADVSWMIGKLEAFTADLPMPPISFDRRQAWMEANPEEVARHPNMWIAVTDDGIVAVASTIPALREEIRKVNLTKLPLVVHTSDFLGPPDPPGPDARQAWMLANPTEIAKYPDTWLAITEDGIVAAGRTLAELRVEVEKSRRAGLDKPPLLIHTREFIGPPTN